METNGETSRNLPAKVRPPKGGNPFKNGFIPTGKRSAKKSQSYLTKKSLLKHMLEVDITIQDLPERFADQIRDILPGWAENVNKRFNMRQIMELLQFQLLFSKSDYVRQDAINAIKDRIDGKPIQKLQVSDVEIEPTIFKLPNGREISI